MQDLTLLSQICQYHKPAHFPLLLITPLGSRRKIAQLVGRYVNAVLTRPVKPSALCTALIDIFSDYYKGIETPSLYESGHTLLARRHPLRILVVEDNLINQRVTLLFLERLGYRADVAANGLEMLNLMQAVPQQPYDVVLMDVQMPEMDGIEATRRIRTGWPSHEQPHIIALSAHTQKKDLDRYLAIGMDGYISKSVRLAELAATLEQCPARSRAPGDNLSPAASFSETTPAPAADTSEQHEAHSLWFPLDLRVIERLKVAMGANAQEKLAELIDIFIKHTTGFFEKLEQAAGNNDTDALYYMAHTLKSSSASVGAMRLSRLCRELESFSRTGNLSLAQERAARIVEELRQVHSALASLRDE
jgi:CheY-like chemotaxis protein